MEVATAMDTVDSSPLQQLEGPGMMEGTPVRMEFSTHACSVLSDLRQSGLLCDAVIKVRPGSTETVRMMKYLLSLSVSVCASPCLSILVIAINHTHKKSEKNPNEKQKLLTDNCLTLSEPDEFNSE